jgi:plastocyanin
MDKKLPIGIAAVVTALALALAACGGGSNPTTAADTAATGSAMAPAAATGGTVKIAADPSQLAFTKTEITAPAGDDTISFDNPSSTDHNVQIEDANGSVIAGTDTISAGKTSTTATLQPGTYTFYCSIPGHREAGMEGTITVK